MDVIRKGSGLTIRFPRFIGNYRLDKAAEDATTVEEIVEMYTSQLKKLQNNGELFVRSIDNKTKDIIVLQYHSHLYLL